MRLVRRFLAVFAACSAAVASGVVASADGGHAKYVCSGGNIPSGNYSSILVTGNCYVPSGLVRVDGNVAVAPGALLDAMTPAGWPATPANLPGIVQVEGNISVGKGAVLFLGCDLAILCTPGNSTYPGPPGLYPTHPELGYSNPGDVVEGNIISVGALGVVVHSVKIGGNASLIGGGGGPAQVGPAPGSGTCFGGPFPAPWTAMSVFAAGFPVYSDFEENSIGGNLTMIGLQTCWMGALRNQVHGNLIDLNNTFGDPDANEVLGNLIGRNIICFNNNSVVQFGDSGGFSNVVSGNALGECGFNVIDPVALVPISVKAP